MYTINVVFEWDDEKAGRNSLKHGIDFRKAAFAFDDPFAFIIDDSKHSAHEARQWLIGDSGSGVIVVVFVVRSMGDVIRIISARRASRKERSIYEENKRV